MRVWHFEQRGRSIALSGNIVGVLPVTMRYDLRRLSDNLTVTGDAWTRPRYIMKPARPASVR
jgi:hypothetical protein